MSSSFFECFTMPCMHPLDISRCRTRTDWTGVGFSFLSAYTLLFFFCKYNVQKGPKEPTPAVSLAPKSIRYPNEASGAGLLFGTNTHTHIHTYWVLEKEGIPELWNVLILLHDRKKWPRREGPLCHQCRAREQISVQCGLTASNNDALDGEVGLDSGC